MAVTAARPRQPGDVKIKFHGHCDAILTLRRVDTRRYLFVKDVKHSRIWNGIEHLYKYLVLCITWYCYWSNKNVADHRFLWAAIVTQSTYEYPCCNGKQLGIFRSGGAEGFMMTETEHYLLKGHLAPPRSQLPMLVNMARYGTRLIYIASGDPRLYHNFMIIRHDAKSGLNRPEEKRIRDLPDVSSTILPSHLSTYVVVTSHFHVKMSVRIEHWQDRAMDHDGPDRPGFCWSTLPKSEESVHIRNVYGPVLGSDCRNE
ncbi:uncharacterized protein EV420DRAFT_1748277 [Desarmillaria tabescens]|uniref:Uncharacterized protein n=1 Tax=Armillaria tabescens TaxID=1929756 RepID=A0AA39N5E4_ARMTA|nr:uncharacterized protein EV420DRAFT_1748277 [Desarmillaria tabescens]KAK0457910.1 hypothetical protein EV420DRAFT_1748277 [Desarmillaria tabescens]